MDTAIASRNLKKNKMNTLELLALTSHRYDWKVKYDYVIQYNCLKMNHKSIPWSIMIKEFEYITNFVKKYNLQFGYEIATAFGISALAAAFGFHETGGKMVTMDAFIEEISEEYTSYVNVKYFKNDENASGFVSVKQLIDFFGLKDVLYPTIGWSPNDTHENINKHIDLNKNKLDYIFIDGGHFENQILKDTESIIDLLNKDKFAVFYHDDGHTHEGSMKLFKEKYNVSPRDCIRLPDGFNLGVFTNLE